MNEIKVRADITASVWKILVAEGDEVAEDDTLMILESMKMEIPLVATEDGVVLAISVAEGDVIAEGDVACVLGVS